MAMASRPHGGVDRRRPPHGSPRSTTSFTRSGVVCRGCSWGYIAAIASVSLSRMAACGWGRSGRLTGCGLGSGQRSRGGVRLSVVIGCCGSVQRCLGVLCNPRLGTKLRILVRGVSARRQGGHAGIRGRRRRRYAATRCWCWCSRCRGGHFPASRCCQPGTRSARGGDEAAVCEREAALRRVGDCAKGGNVLVIVNVVAANQGGLADAEFQLLIRRIRRIRRQASGHSCQWRWRLGQSCRASCACSRGPAR